MLLPAFEFAAPQSTDAACALLAQAPGEARLIAGGTDLLVRIKRGVLAPRLVISLARIGGLDSIEPFDGGLRLGACASMSAIAASGAVASRWRALAEGAGSVGGPIIRNRATLGGNIVNARPCADTLPPLIALQARLRLCSSGGQRMIDVDGFVQAPGQCAIAADEVLTAIELADPPARAGSAYLKLTRRAAMEVTIVGCAASVHLDAAGERITHARLVFTSVAPVPLRIESAEAVLLGQAPTARLLQQAAEEAQRVAPAIGDHRAPKDYRVEMVAVSAHRALRAAIERAGGRIA